MTIPDWFVACLRAKHDYFTVHLISRPGVVTFCCDTCRRLATRIAEPAGRQ